MQNTSETISGCSNRTAAGSYPQTKDGQDMEWLSGLVNDQEAGTKDSHENAKTQLSEQLAASTEVKFANPRYPQRTYPMHRSVWEWCKQNITNSTGETRQARTHATHEISMLFDKFLRHGSFSFNSTRVRKVVGDGAGRLLKKFVDNCPYVRQTHDYIPGKRCRGFTFELPGITFAYATDINEDCSECFDRATVNGIRVGMIDRRMLVTVDVPGHWLLCRSAKWHVVALLNGWTVGVDSFGTNFGGGVHHAFANLSVDKALNVRCQADVPCGVRECAKCEHARAYHSKLVNRSFSPCVTLIRGRLYHACSSCPKSLRGHLLLDGERFGEVDISGSYLCALTSQLWEDTATQRRQKEQLISLLQTGEIYERIADECGYAWTDRGELKRQFNMQCLFWREKTPESARPLWSGLSRLFPNLARLIMGVRRCSGGASGLSDWVCDYEKDTMFAIFNTVGKAGIKFLPNHDGILIAQSNVPEVREIAIRVATEVLGFEPAVKVKYTH